MDGHWPIMIDLMEALLQPLINTKIYTTVCSVPKICFWQSMTSESLQWKPGLAQILTLERFWPQLLKAFTVLLRMTWHRWWRIREQAYNPYIIDDPLLELIWRLDAPIGIQLSEEFQSLGNIHLCLLHTRRAVNLIHLISSSTTLQTWENQLWSTANALEEVCSPAQCLPMTKPNA